MSKEERIEKIKEALVRGRDCFHDAAGGMEKLGDKKGAATVRKCADEAAKTIPANDPKQR